MQLAGGTAGAILALDNHRPYLDELNRRAGTLGFTATIETRLGDMQALTLDRESSDLVWSEGAVYVMGFQNGLESCFRLLVPGGFIAVTELCWLRPGAPAECRAFFGDEYPAMVDVETNLAFIERCGCELLWHFTLPESAWWEPYYLPLEARLQELRGGHAADSEKLEMVEWVQSDIEMYRENSDFYCCVFFMMRR